MYQVWLERSLIYECAQVELLSFSVEFHFWAMYTNLAINDNGDAIRVLAKSPLPFHVTTWAKCHATDVVKLPNSGIEPEIFSYRIRCSNHWATGLGLVIGLFVWIWPRQEMTECLHWYIFIIIWNSKYFNVLKNESQ